MLTAIIPIDLKRRPKDIIQKAISIAEATRENNFKIIFSHGNRFTKYDHVFIEALSEYNHVIVNSYDCSYKYINTSLLRNFAFKLVDTEFIILLDVDIYPDVVLFEKYKNKIQKGVKPFYILPCLYLTKHGTHILIKKKISVELLKKRYFDFSRKEFLHLASPSSITILKSESYKKIHGFDESFQGHGYEDFDFLIRLYNHHFLSKLKSDFLIDKPCHSPLFTTGFRKYLGEYCLDILLQKDLALHLYHDKKHNDSYYSAREENYRIFRDKYKNAISDECHYDTTLLLSFIQRCIDRGDDIRDYSIYFDNKPGHVDRYDTMYRKVKYILGI
ncbi:galactosyltransferase-related protein [Escherichia coli]